MPETVLFRDFTKLYGATANCASAPVLFQTKPNHDRRPVWHTVSNSLATPIWLISSPCPPPVPHNMWETNFAQLETDQSLFQTIIKPICDQMARKSAKLVLSWPQSLSNVDASGLVKIR